MKPKKNSMYVFIGASISSRDAQEAKQIVERIRRVCQVLDRLGHTYDANILTDPSVHREAKDVNLEIPKKYLKNISDALVESIRGLRVENPPYGLKEEIACYHWSLDLLTKAGACIWDLTKSSSGSGFEIASALQLRKPCLALFDRPTVSTMINGCTSRLLTIRRWDDNIETTVEQFIRKAQQGLDRTVRFNVTHEMTEWIEKGAEERGCETTSEYLRSLVEDDWKRRDSKKSEIN